MRKGIVVGCLLVAALAGAVSAGPGWRQYFVIDARLAALRSAPGLTSPILKRLRVGRAVYGVGRALDREGRPWLRVAVTRRTRGWILADALAAPGDAAGERWLGVLVAALRGIDRVEVARLAFDRFPHLRASAREALASEAASAA